MNKTKVCNICHIKKPREEFNKQLWKGRYYERYLCKKCQVDYQVAKGFIKEFPDMMKGLEARRKKYINRRRMYETYLKENYHAK